MSLRSLAYIHCKSSVLRKGIPMKVHAALAATLRDSGVDTMFGLVGDGNMFIVDSFARAEGTRYVAAAFEASSVMMAVGYASASGGVGVASVTHGPGLANTFGALVEGVRSRAAVVLIVGDTAFSRRGSAQKIDQAAVVRPTGAGFELARSPSLASADLIRALRRAQVERRPIVFNVPSEFQFVEVEYRGGARAAGPAQRTVSPDPAALDVAVGIIASARSPLILAGAGATSPAAGKSLQQLAEKLGAPVSTTLPAKGTFAGNPYDLGVFGTFSPPSVADVILASDCIIAVGASLNEYTGGGARWPYLAGKRIVHCDIDPAAIDMEYAVDAPVVADAVSFASTVVAWLEEGGYTPTKFRDSVDLSRFASAAERPAEGFVELATALKELNGALPPDRSFVVDGGRFMGEAVRYLEVSRPQSWLCTFRGFAAVGHGVAGALGVGCALPRSPVVAVVGDGGFMLGGLTEFNTAVRHNIDLITIVCNDGSYGSEYLKFKARDIVVDTCMFDWPDFAPVAESLGGQGYTVRNLADLGRIGDVIRDRERPLLIDIKLDPATVPAAH
jgi:acetolactate synthase I/II/III large subunit